MMRSISPLSASRFSSSAKRNLMVMRPYSMQNRFNKINQSYNNISNEDSKEAKATLKVIRRMGGISIIVVLCSLFWASSFMDQPRQVPEVLDLKKDVRD